MNEHQRALLKYHRRISLFVSLVSFVAFLICLIISICSQSKDDQGRVVYPRFSSMLSFLFLVICVVALLVYLGMRIYGFIRNSRGPAWKVKREEFHDDLQEGVLVKEMKIDRLTYSDFFFFSLHGELLLPLILMGVMMILCIGCALYCFFAKDVHFYGFVLFSVIFFVLIPLFLFLFPLGYLRNEKEYIHEYVIYEDRISFLDKEGKKMDLYYSSFDKAIPGKKTVVYILNESVLFLPYTKDMDPKTWDFILLKGRQINNHHKIH